MSPSSSLAGGPSEGRWPPLAPVVDTLKIESEDIEIQLIPSEEYFFDDEEIEYEEDAAELSPQE